MFVKAMLLLIPMVTQADINVKFSMYPDVRENYGYGGENIDVVGEKDRQTFGISDEPLKKAVEIFSGKKPDDVFVRSPTPLEDIYKTKNLSQVTRTLKPYDIKVINNTNERVVTFSREFTINRSTGDILYANIIVNTVETTWSSNDELELGQEILHVWTNKHNEVLFRTKFGENVKQEEILKIDSKHLIQIVLEPHQKVIANMTVTRYSAEAQISYVAWLDGYIACKYGYWYQTYNINEILDAAQIPKQKEFKEFIHLKYYLLDEIVVTDVQTLKTIDNTESLRIV